MSFDVVLRPASGFNVTFGGEPPVVPAGSVKFWNGTAWMVKPMKFWNGSSWVTRQPKRWNGTSWV